MIPCVRCDGDEPQRKCDRNCVYTIEHHHLSCVSNNFNWGNSEVFLVNTSFVMFLEFWLLKRMNVKPIDDTRFTWRFVRICGIRWRRRVEPPTLKWIGGVGTMTQLLLLLLLWLLLWLWLLIQSSKWLYGVDQYCFYVDRDSISCTRGHDNGVRGQDNGL